MILPIFHYDHPVLRKKAQPITVFDDALKKFADDLVESMIHHNGVGLAGPQVGRSLRIFVMRDEWVDSDGRYHLGSPEIVINPIILEYSKETVTLPEACLSLPNLHAEVTRPLSIRLRCQRPDGRTEEEFIKGYRARIMLHENDHINGVLYIDRVKPDIRKRIDPFLRKIKQKYQTAQNS